MEINPSEVTKILKEQIKKFGDKAEVTEVGQVLSVGDGIARIYGLDNVRKPGRKVGSLKEDAHLPVDS